MGFQFSFGVKPIPGPKGDPGDTGAPGPVGERGPKGVKGDPGEVSYETREELIQLNKKIDSLSMVYTKMNKEMKTLQADIEDRYKDEIKDLSDLTSSLVNRVSYLESKVKSKDQEKKKLVDLNSELTEEVEQLTWQINDHNKRTK